MEKIIRPNGAIEYIFTAKEKTRRKKFRSKKNGSTLTLDEVKELVFELARKENLL